MKSDFCPEYTFICNVDSQMSRLFEKVINNEDAQQECKLYEVCFDLSSLDLNYSIGYNCSYENESEVINATRATNVVRCDQQFSITTYLTSSPFCNEISELLTIQGNLESQCIEFNESFIPEKCINGDDDDDDDDSKSKKSNVPLIAGLSCASVVIVATAVVVSIILIRKKGNIQYLNNSIRENLNNDDNYTNINSN